MTETSPFRRFPLVQLVFCVACLTMTVWTWMRYSYAWEVTPSQFFVIDPDRSDPPSEIDPALNDYYVCVHGCLRQLPEGGHPGTMKYVVTDWQGFVVVTARPDRTATPGDSIEFCGRAFAWRGAFFPTVDATFSRFHPGSIAGLVVGAMGCFVFGLYLRRWLRERKAAA